MFTPRAYVYFKEKPPCLNCSDRLVGCHSKCEKYQKWRAKIKKDAWNNTQRLKGEREAENYTQKKFSSIKQYNMKHKRRVIK